MDLTSYMLRLANLREQKGFTARGLSIFMGQNPAYINQIENMKKNLYFAAFLEICECLEITAKDFFDDGNCYPETLNGIIVNLKLLDKDTLALVAGIIEVLVKDKKNIAAIS